jgi:serine protease inhibitor
MRTILKIALVISTLSLMASETAIGRGSKSLVQRRLGTSRIVTANNQFGFELLNQLQLQDKTDNIFFSPLSVAFALAMTYNGAAGETSQAMARTLKLNEMGRDQINRESARLLESLNSADPNVTLNIANSLWVRQGVKLNEEFLTRNRGYFGAEIATLNFDDPTAKVTINNWVSKSTSGKIPTIIEEIKDSHVLFLINAVYFKAEWLKKFEKKLTKNQPFYLLSGRQTDANDVAIGWFSLLSRRQIPGSRSSLR